MFDVPSDLCTMSETLVGGKPGNKASVCSVAIISWWRDLTPDGGNSRFLFFFRGKVWLSYCTLGHPLIRLQKNAKPLSEKKATNGQDCPAIGIA